MSAWAGRRGQLSGDEFWLAEVVNCTVVADLKPLAEDRSGPSLKIVDFSSDGTVREPKLSRA